MSCRAELAWIGFENSQKSIDALKDEIFKAEKKLQNVRKSFSLTVSKSKSENQVSLTKQSITNSQNRLKRRKIIQHSRKEIFQKTSKPLLRTSIKEPHIVLEGPSTFKAGLSQEDQPKPFPQKSHGSKELKRKLVESALYNVVSRLSSTDNSVSSNGYPPKESSSDQTSSLIAVAYQNIDRKLHDVISRCKSRKHQDQLNVVTLHGKETVPNDKAGDFRYTEVKPVASTSLQSVNTVDGIHWRIPNSRTSQLRSCSIASTSGLQKVKQIVEEQKKRQELLNSDLDDSLFLGSDSTSHKKSVSNGVPPTLTEGHESKVVQTDPMEDQPQNEEPTKPPPIRKTRPVRTFPQYKGFSAYGNVGAKTKISPPTNVKVSPVNKTSLSPKRFKRTVKCNEELASASCWRKSKIVPKVKSKISHAADSKATDIGSSKSQSTTEHSEEKILKNGGDKGQEDPNVTIDLSGSPKKGTVSEELPSSKTSSEPTSKIVDLLSEEKENTSPMKKSFKSTKRKAVKPLEQSPQSPKIRHYDVHKVRNYIQKKKAERKKRKLDEAKKQIQDLEMKKSKLQQLYDFQKQNIRNPCKARLPASVTLPDEKATVKRVYDLPEIVGSNKNFPSGQKTHLSSRETDDFKMLQDLHKTDLRPISSTSSPSKHKSTDMAHVSSKSPKAVSHQYIFNLDSDKEQAGSSVNQEKLLDKENEPVTLVDMANGAINSESSPAVLNGERVGDNASGSFTFDSSLNFSIDINEAELQMFQLQKEKVFVFETEKSNALKHLAKSVQSHVDDLSKQFEGFLRTKKWVEESPPPPNQKSDPRREPQVKVTSSAKTVKRSIDFAHASNMNESVRSFQERITSIGDTTKLYSKIIGKKHPETQTMQEVISYRKESIVTDESRSSLTQYTLKSGVETDASDIKVSNDHLILPEDIPNHEFAKKPIEKQAALFHLEEFVKHAYYPDPFNFINTWKRKPLDIPCFPKESKRNFSESSSMTSLRPNSSQKAASSLGEKNYSSDFEESDHISDAVRHLTSTDLDSHEQDGTTNPSNHKASEEAKQWANHSTPTEGNLSNASVSFIINSVHSDAVSDVSMLKENELHLKTLSQSDSSISEIISVVENSKDPTPTENDNPDVLKSSSSNSLVKPDAIQVVHDLLDSLVQELSNKVSNKSESEVHSVKSSSASEIKSIEDLSPVRSLGDSPIHVITDVHSVAADNKETPVSAIESVQDASVPIREISPVPAVSEADSVSTVGEASPMPSHNEVSPEASVSEANPISANEANSLHSASEAHTVPSASQAHTVPSTSEETIEKSNVTANSSEGKHFAPPNADLIRKPGIRDVSESQYKKLQSFPDFPHEQFIHPHIVARVATEAATAAATSAVLAVLETQKAFLGKKHILSIPEKDTNSSRQPSPHYSSDFESSPTNLTISDQSQKGGSKSKSSKSSVSEAISNVAPDSRESSPVDIEESLKTAESSAGKSSVQTAEELQAITKGVSKKDNKQLTLSSKRKFSSNISSPSPASLSDNDSASSAGVVTTNSSVSGLSHHSESLQSVQSDDSFAQLTLDVVRQMTYEEELRVRHQLLLLQFQEKTLVEKARAEMMWLELLKKKLREKGADRKVSAIKKRQKDLISRLRRERIQLQRMQESYRNMCEKHQALPSEKKKPLTEPMSLEYQVLNRKEKCLTSGRPSKESLKNVGQPFSASSSTPSIATEEEIEAMNKMDVTPEVPEALEVPKSFNSNSSQESVIETYASGSTQSPQLTISKSETLSNIIPSQQLNPEKSSQSLESALQGLKKLEASKRHLTKREQRIGQRRKHAESLLQWQMKLDSEEKAVRELEQKALELVDHSKKKSKYYVSSSMASTSIDKPSTLSKTDFSTRPEEGTPSKDAPSEVVSSESRMTENVKVSTESKESSSVPEESLRSKSESVEEEVIKEKTSVSQEVATNTKTSSSIQEDKLNRSTTSSVVEESMQSQNAADISEEIPSVLSPSPKDKSSSPETYSESFESAASPQTPNSTRTSTLQKNSESQYSAKRSRSLNIRLPLVPRNIRRHDSSGSDDSYTISHSETASDQSDIEGRIHALAEELKKRKAEAEKLKRQHKKRYREQLKEKELSLQKQLEAYNQYIQQTRIELEHQLECASLPHGSDISSGGVKPQIKSPRIEHGVESRRLRKQAALSPPEPSPEKTNESINSSPDSPDNSILSLSLTKGRPINLLKKVTLDSKEISPAKPLESKTPSNSISTQNASGKTTQAASEVSSQESQASASPTESDTFISSESMESSRTKPEGDNDTQKSLQKDDKTGDGSADVTISEKTLSSSQSNKTLQPESSQSVESESIAEEHSTVNDGSIEEDVASGNFECDGSDGCATPPPPPPPQKGFSQVVEDPKVSADSVTSQQLGGDVALTLVKRLEKGGVKDQVSEALVMNIVGHVFSSLLDDSIGVILNLPGSKNPSLKSHVSPDESKKAKTESVTLAIFKSMLSDAITTVTKILKDDKGSMPIKLGSGKQKIDTSAKKEALSNKIKPILTNNDHSKAKSRFLESEDFVGYRPEFTKPELSPIKGDAYKESIFNKQIDWLEDDLDMSKGDSYLQQLEQQILLQQYPYYYRKIPNKPPPPYTPPSKTEGSAKAPPDESDSVMPVRNNINPVVECVVDIILEGKKQGLSIKDIPAPKVLPVAETLQMTSQCQLIFMSFIFDLVKEIAVDLFLEKEKMYMAWERPRKLTPKPLFPMDKNKLVPILQKEVQLMLKIPPGYVQPDPRNQLSLRSTMKLGRKERDFVDTILISELKEEEPDWVNYDQDELTVKNQIADAVINYIIDDTVKVFQDLL